MLNSRPKHYIDAMKVYDSPNFDPSEVHPGNRWRELAMREWVANHRPGLVPIVSDKVPVLDKDHCLSCGALIDFSQDQRPHDKQVYTMHVCHFCEIARGLISQKVWTAHKKSADPTEEGLQENKE